MKATLHSVLVKGSLAHLFRLTPRGFSFRNGVGPEPFLVTSSVQERKLRDGRSVRTVKLQGLNTGNEFEVNARAWQYRPFEEQNLS